MRFVNPAFLFALSAISIPILIHLFNFRKFKTVYFTNVRFLREVKEETQSKSQLKHLLVLLCRILAITFLVLAFAQPYIPYHHQKVNTGSKALSLYIDNSFSMDAENKSGRLLDEAKKDARDIASAYRPTDQFQLLTNDFEGRHQRLVNREEFLELLDEVKLSPAVKNMSQVFSRQADLLNNAGRLSGSKLAFLIGDFQKSISDFDRIKNDTSVTVHLIPVVPQERKNLYIDSCWFETPVRKLNTPQLLHVRLRNSSAQEYTNIPMKLFINGQQKTPSSFHIAPMGKTDTVIAFTIREPGWQQGRVEITDSPITFDDTYYFSFEASASIPVLCISPAPKTSVPATANTGRPVAALFGHDSAFRFSEVRENAIDYSAIAKYKLIVLDGLSSVSSGLGLELNRFLQNGGSLLIFPSAHIDAGGYTDFLSSIHANTFQETDTADTKVDKLNFEHEIYREGVFEKKNGRLQTSNLDLPSVLSHYRMSRSSRSGEEDLMTLRNGDPFLSKYTIGKGSLYICSAALTPEASNFQKHALFVPTLLQIAFFSQQQNRMSYTIGNNEVVELNSTPSGTEHVFHILSGDGKFDIIPEHRIIDSKTNLFIRNQVSTSGNYNLKSDTDLVAGLSFNYNRKESDITTLSPAELTGALEKAGLVNFNVIEKGQKELSSLLSEMDQGQKLWKICIWLALIFLAAEVALLRLLK
ncbi:MAG TPA: BatA domain-containing protein [Bacteroidia bacterium]|jgi:hypothetical protein|nr:BatA domain-containing protein [Bacteroidia bacterium]